MIKPTATAARQPIYLTKLKKKVRNCENRPPLQSEGIEYDLQIFQESLNIQKGKVAQGEGMVLQEKAVKGNQENNRMGSQCFVTGGKWISNCNLSHTMGTYNDRSISQRIEQGGYYTNAHKAMVSCKPNTSEAINKENAILYQPQLANLKARTVQTITKSKAEALKEIHCILQEGSAQSEFKQKNQEILSPLQYQTIIKELEQKNVEAQLKIAELQARLKVKEGVSERVEKLEKQIIALYEEKMWFEKNAMESRQEAYIQTDFIPLYVQDAYCQTQAYEPDFHHRMSEMRRSQGMLTREMEYKTIIENIQIENRQVNDRLLKQLEAISMKYESKCREVQEKEELINRYCFRKHDNI